ncbi:MAG: RNA helicase required for poly(A+) mRNA export [Watsoniomyces obsoletus]|nr:MAG: RNA helicase required for poly(A+) mRNA export [Watsoniomyces obsoletus]
MSTEKTPPTMSSLSLEDRITKPNETSTPTKPENGGAASKPAEDAKTEDKEKKTNKPSSWADDVASPTGGSGPSSSIPAPTESKSKDEKKDVKPSEVKSNEGPSKTQLDGPSDDLPKTGLTEPDYTVEVKLSDIQADPNNPLYSVCKSFEELGGLTEAIIRGLHAMNFRKPSKIQERALPLLLHDPPQNMIGQSQSGTGKTAAFVLTMLMRVDPKRPTIPQALCLAPTRELARQIMGVIQEMSQFMETLTVQFAIPQSLGRGQKLASQIIVGTPGTVLDMIKKRMLDTKEIKVFVLDEADNMLDQQGLGEQCLRVKMTMPKQAQILLFSATFPDEVMRYAERFAPRANQLKLKHDELTVEGIRQLYLDCSSENEKYDILVKLYGLMTIGASIIFVKRRDTASEIERRMTAEGHKVVALHGAFEGHERDAVIDSFRGGDAKVLITTNVLARGIDVDAVSMVINYDIPTDNNNKVDPQTYLHRIGRTGRFGRVGVSISFVYDKKSWSQLQEIARYFGVPIQGVDTKDWDEVERAVQSIIKSSRAGTNLVIS